MQSWGKIFVSGFMEICSCKAQICVMVKDLWLFATFFVDAPADLVPNAALMTLTGTVIGGVASLISTAVSADLGRQPQLSNSREALSTVTGIIDGTGSAGAAIGQVIHKITSLHKTVYN